MIITRDKVRLEFDCVNGAIGNGVTVYENQFYFHLT